MDKLLGTDKVSPTGKDKINGIIDKLRSGYLGQVPVSNGNGDDFTWQDIEATIPGGTEGQVLTKNSATPYDYSFENPYKPYHIKAITTSATITTSQTFTGVTSSSDNVRTNIITINFQSYAVAETQFDVELKKDGITIKTWQTATNDTSTDNESYADVKSFTYYDEDADASSDYEVEITKGAGSSSIRILSYIIVLMGI